MLAALLATEPARAEPDLKAQPLAAPASSSGEDGEDHFAMALFEGAVSLAIPGIYYWSTTSQQAVDWTLGWDWQSWEAKLLTTDKFKFDTNPFHVNAIRHPLAGVIDYQIGRTNGMGLFESTLFAYVTGAIWEFMFEYREDPSINDLIFNGAGGLAIGEPMWRIGQLWRGGALSLGDRARTAVFSPFDTFHDTYRAPHRWWRPRAWRTIELSAGAIERRIEGVTRGELGVAADFDVVADPRYARGEPIDRAIEPGAWSRLRISARVGGREGSGFTGTSLHTRTALVGHYEQDADGFGQLVALGAGFTYRSEWLVGEHDQLALAHLLGPQIQLARRTSHGSVRWDLAAYGDFGLVHALIFGPDSFPSPPPFYSALQAEGYIDAYGLSAITRLRGDDGPWRADLELSGHLLHQISGYDRDGEGAPTAALTAPGEVVSTTGVGERRVFWRGQLTYQPGRWGIGITTDGAYRRSTWEDQTRNLIEYAGGLVLQLDY